MVVALVGATGLVGNVMMRVMEERRLPVSRFLPCASARSAGRKLDFNGKSYEVIPVEEAIEARPQLVIFSAGAAVSRQHARTFADNGAFVIDNSSAWRSHEDVPLVVPEVNAHTISKKTRIIANPNCSTIQMVLVIAPIHRRFVIRRLVVSTYQSVTGTGVQAVEQLQAERAGRQAAMAYPYPIDLNCFPHGGDFLDNGYSSEEMKLVNETRKILDSPDMRITATVVRIPVIGGHSEAVNIELASDFRIAEIRELLEVETGIVVSDDPSKNIYPMPKYAEGRDEVFAGRIRRDTSVPFGLDLWIVADNLRKGAATNAVQIAQHLIREKLLST